MNTSGFGPQTRVKECAVRQLCMASVEQNCFIVYEKPRDILLQGNQAQSAQENKKEPEDMKINTARKETEKRQIN